jgi:hypothetical protein
MLSFFYLTSETMGIPFSSTAAIISPELRSFAHNSQARRTRIPCCPYIPLQCPGK